MNRSLVLCADDFGLSDDINRAILELVRQGRLSATSCMSLMPAWTADAAAQLRELETQAALGVHFNLTEGEQAIPLGKLMQLSLCGRIDTNRVQSSLEQQLDRFEHLAGRTPDFVDGHQHIQMFPGIRRIVLTTLVRRYGADHPWLRVSTPALQGHDARFKALVLRLMGTGFNAQRHRYGVRGNRDFAGMYSLRPDAGFDRMMRHWLDTLPDGALIMCHPGYASSHSALARARDAERAWLAGPRFAAALRDSGRLLVKQPRLD
ncbi:ChbG/HpnK family deacetylase [Marinobacterium marinum]|uniref:ChbG/HpnK family deacetylase n=1 Tax=Marinobacterium marinum TaxID=2756129 RepID=A0A7W1X0L9_9GAMM|nr:ChbG/HpnK family deacetylase [Marinobacterium marinum]MBA4503641.1 ChbG/HpnK family deacetylase [Marinobacterium marinum]